MRILYITSADFERTDAPTVRARGLAVALAGQGCRVTMLGINGCNHNGSYRYRSVRYPPWRRLGQIIYQLALAARLMGRENHDCVLLRETPFCVQPYLLGRPVYLEVNGLALEELRGTRGLRRRVAERLYRWGYRRAHAIFALTPSIKQYLVDRAGAPADRVHVVSNAVEVDRFYPVDRSEARRSLDLPGDVPIVFYVGSYHRQHGLPNMLRAAEMLRTPCLFLMAGSGAERETAFRNLVQQRQLGARFRFLGRVDDDTLRLAIGASNLCLNPAAEETHVLTDATFPQKLLEYLACGRPVLSMGNAPAIRALLEGERAGIVVSATAEALAEGLDRTLPKRAELQRMGERGLTHVRDQFSYPRVVQKYLERFRHHPR